MTCCHLGTMNYTNLGYFSRVYGDFSLKNLATQALDHQAIADNLEATVYDTFL